MPTLSPPSVLRFEHRTDPGPARGLGIDRPRLSWRIADAPADYIQSGYDIELVRSGQRTLWSVESAEQVLVPWPAEPLTSRESVSVRVRVRGSGHESHWSEPAVAEAGQVRLGDPVEPL